MYSDSHVKYLEMIQRTIERMSSNSFILKGWAVTLVAAIFVVSDISAYKYYFLLVYIPIILFWLLDAYYLGMERRYRLLFEKALLDDSALFNMRPCDHPEGNRRCFASAALSFSVLLFYIPLALITSLVIVFTAIGG